MKIQQWNGADFPHVIAGSDSLPEYVAANQHPINQALAACGAILFRGFDVPTAEDFDAVVQAYGEPGFTYSESLSNAVRVNVTDRVFTANEAPPDTSIYLHHEMAQTPLYPSKLFFYCQIAAEKGGATPLCRSDILIDQLREADPDLVARLESRGVRYTNVMPASDDSGSGQGRSWRSTLNAETTEDAESRLLDLGYGWEWMDNGSLRVTTPVLDAVRQLPDGRTVFFNQLIAAFRGWSDQRNDASRALSFGDGEPITADDMREAIVLSDELSFDTEWEAGDVMLIDNFLVMHGRRPFEGTRRVLASLIS
ncbi:TauD/TfdA family dioxygenase [Parasphingorhabdus sp.]|uniref:TauD/TfdA family dioxygenase n=1 Tax=Parasphingorhabdus sp. TaxID=2709688 RepID=UPI0032679E28